MWLITLVKLLIDGAGMTDIHDLERTTTIRIIQDDADTILSLLSSVHDSVFAMEIIPYYALFVQSCQECMGSNFIPEGTVTNIRDMRNHIKVYADSFGKSKRRIALIDSKQDMSLGSQLKFGFLKNLNIHYNLGIYLTEDRHIIGNTQQLADFLGVEDIFDQGVGNKFFDLGKQVGRFVAFVNNYFPQTFIRSKAAQTVGAVKIKYYCDINTNRHNKLFVDNECKELNLFYLHLLCGMNFVRYILCPLFPMENTWVFRVEYIVTYYTFRALTKLKSHCESNDDVISDINGIEDLKNGSSELFQSKFRNCMMHYGLENQNLLSIKYIDRPFFGIIENCFDGMDYKTYVSALHDFSDKLICFLEEHFDCSDIKLKQLT